MTAAEIQQRLQALGNPAAAALCTRFFKTGPGQYGEGDIFLGLNATTMRRVARDCRGLPL
ncbi:MAG: DNA alkylation repair protein, partial [Gemmataceae bacterium]